MLWTIFVVLLLAWLICVVALKIVHLAIHLLLVVAVGVVLYQMIGKGGNSHRA